MALNFFSSLTKPSKYLFISSTVGTVLGVVIAVMPIYAITPMKTIYVGIALIVVSFISSMLSLGAFINFTRLKNLINLAFLFFFLVNLFLFYVAFKAITNQTPF